MITAVLKVFIIGFSCARDKPTQSEIRRSAFEIRRFLPLFAVPLSKPLTERAWTTHAQPGPIFAKNCSMKTARICHFVIRFLFGFLSLSTALATGQGEKSEKPAAILIHGSPGNKSSFQDLLQNPRIQKYADVWIDNLPGAGDKANTDVVYSFEDQVKMVQDQIQQLPKSKPILLVGYSYGSVIALRIAELNSERNIRIVNISSVTNPQNITVEWYLCLLEKLGSAFSLFSPIRQAHEDSSNLSKTLNFVLSGLQQIKAQVILVHGEKDHLVPPRDLEVLNELKPTIHIRPNKGHDLMKTDRLFIGYLLVEIAKEMTIK